ncbi:malto-oligosyltrehalose synthase [Propionicicella superfundia]|uniref:malto-oligosyltrehalose synthase n=1 Tax=Propionicicella superfundia TaxID=348582 RepID=UPI00040CD78C|nr:malto-oligosyltrehalose synthase [Propionicicella superfundia]
MPSETEHADRLRPHLPSPGRRVPVTTYRLQLGPNLTFAQAADRLDYLQRLGITDLYLSPILAASPGSTHGYDVVDHSRISEALGGREGFEALARAAHERDMGVIVDVVPNHMSFPTPLYANRALWSVLKEGPQSPYANWFDGIDTSDGLLMPVLGARIGTVIATDQISLTWKVIPGFEDEGEQGVLEYYDRVFPVRAGTETLPLAECVQQQFYRLAYWKVADEELNYRRFFDVDTLAAIRVEDPEVFEATHALLLELYHAGYIDGFRIDHPDGLADPRGYLRRLSIATGGAWIVAEKILSGGEMLPDDWPVSGTTGYDASWRIGALQVDSAGGVNLTMAAEGLGESQPSQLHDVVDASKREIIATSLSAEVHRLASLAQEIVKDDIYLRDHTFRWLRRCLIELIVAFDRYRAYIVPGQDVHPDSRAAIERAAEIARRRLDEDLLDTLDVVVDLVTGVEVGSAGHRQQDLRDELVVRFQQVCGAVEAKGVEDTAFYRWTPLVSLNEVGGSPTAWSYGPDQFHAWCSEMSQRWPATMTVGTTHDTKRGEDVRARINVISQFSVDWLTLLEKVHPLVAGLDGATENLLWQTLAGTWTDEGPISADRLKQYMLKASREMKTWTTWTSPDTEAEDQVLELIDALLTDDHVMDAFGRWAQLTHDANRTAVLSRKIIQLTCLGVGDIYQGTETTQTHLVDPDNRRPVDVAALSRLLTSVQERPPSTLAEEKLFITHRICDLRRRRPQAFVGEAACYRPLATTTGHLIAYERGAEVVVLATRLSGALTALGGFQEHTVALPEGRWTDIFTGLTVSGGLVRLADVLGPYPSAVFERLEEA